MSNVILTTKLDFWVENNKNVLFVGKHGVGKTAMVIDTWQRHKLNYRYFSASTMDPWVDFIGVPREKTENKIPEQFEIIRELARMNFGIAVEWVKSNWKLGDDSSKQVVEHAISRVQGVTHLDLVRPQAFADGGVEALFFDEFNRSPKKVRNAVMELMQFKSINGYRFPNLKMVWAAINPDDDENETYDVERLDPAQQDRYHIRVLVPYKPNAEWFRKEYTPRIADAAIQWWDELPEEQKNLVSPRRLQYALDVFREKGDIRDVLPVTSNVSKLSTALHTGPMTEKLEDLMQSKDAQKARDFLSNENSYASAMKYIPGVPTLVNYFLPLIPKEKLGVLMSDDDKMCKHIIDNSDRVPIFMNVCKEIMEANTNVRIVKKIRKALTDNEQLSNAYKANSSTQPAESHFNKAKTGWGDVLAELKVAPKNNPEQRLKIYDEIVQKIPEKMTADEALDGLTLLNEIFCAGPNNFSSNLATKPLEKLMGTVNQCISELHRNTGYNWGKILIKHGIHFKGLLEKIQTAGLNNKLYQPK